MKAEYTCVDAAGNKYAVVCETSKSIDEIKELADEQHRATIVDVVGERALGGQRDEEEEDDDE